MTRADTTRDIGQSEVSMLGIYLNDHLAWADSRHRASAPDGAIPRRRTGRRHAQASRG